MITENPAPALRAAPRPAPKVLKITKETQRHLVLTDGSVQMLFRRYDLQHASSLEFLRKRSHLRHEGLLQIYKVECEHDLEREAERQTTNCGVLFEKYSKTLGESVKEMVNFTPEEVIETLQPVRETIDYLIAQDYDPGEITLASIVCTEHYDIKFLEAPFHTDTLRLTHRPHFPTLLYQELAALLFQLLFPHDVQVKSWKCRYELAQKKLDEKYLQFYRDLYMKFAPTFVREEKSRKIKKGAREVAVGVGGVGVGVGVGVGGGGVGVGVGVRERRRREKAEGSLKWQHGKENKIIQ